MMSSSKHRDLTPHSPHLHSSHTESPQYHSATPPPHHISIESSSYMTPPNPRLFDALKIAPYPSPASNQESFTFDFHHVNHPAFIPNDTPSHVASPFSSPQTRIALPAPLKGKKKKKKFSSKVIEDGEEFEPDEPTAGDLQRYRREVAEIFSRDLIFGGEASEIDPTFIKANGTYRRQHNSWVIFEMGMLRTLDQFVKIHYNFGPIRKGDRLFSLLRQCCLQMVPEETLARMSGVNFMSVKARYWDRRSNDERKIFADAAKEFTKLHKLRYPDYIYKPRQILAKKSKKRLRASNGRNRRRSPVVEEDEENDSYFSPSPEPSEISQKLSYRFHPIRQTRSHMSHITSSTSPSNFHSHDISNCSPPEKSNLKPLNVEINNEESMMDEMSLDYDSRLPFDISSSNLTQDSQGSSSTMGLNFNLFPGSSSTSSYYRDGYGDGYGDGYYGTIDQSSLHFGIPPSSSLVTTNQYGSSDIPMDSESVNGLMEFEREEGGELKFSHSDWKNLELRIKNEEGQGFEGGGEWNFNEILKD